MDSHGAATSTRSRVLQRGNLKTSVPAKMSSSPNQLYLTWLRDTINAGLLQLAHHVSCYTESTFSQFSQEYHVDTAHMIY